jgi:tetraacyldisaccharide 4'-kinase
VLNRWPERIWYGDSAWTGLARGALAPAGWLYAGATALRNRLYDARLLHSEDPALPTLDIGNISVGGTGKTPVAAWAAAELLRAGARPAIVLRGYGDDEPLVHARLNPAALISVDADRVRGVERARAAGADCVILDDAFQHRRIRRNEDWLLIAAEQWRPTQRCLPAGPLREPVRGMARASVIAVTRKSASGDRAEAIATRIEKDAPGVPTAIFHLAPEALRSPLDDSMAPLSMLDGARVLAIAAVGAPDAFLEQLRQAGAQVEAMVYRDHHAFDAQDAASLARRAAAVDLVVCTLKDAVKLAPLWPHKGPALWYVSQCAVVERGRSALDISLTNILASRASAPPTAGPAGPGAPDHGYRSSPADQ